MSANLCTGRESAQRITPAEERTGEDVTSTLNDPPQPLVVPNKNWTEGLSLEKANSSRDHRAGFTEEFLRRGSGTFDQPA